MITQIIKSYLTILISIGSLSLLFFLLGLFWIVKFFSKSQQTQSAIASHHAPFMPNSIPDVTAISGDDVIATQLDLARAYLEVGQGNLAKGILESVAKKGTEIQKIEAQQLLSIT
jgi:FimV-like protein